jgi:hypothetical protein
MAERSTTCRGCGCDDDHACITKSGPCAWTLLDFVIDATGPRGTLAVERMPTGVCSACAEAVRFDPRALVTMGFIDDSEAAA